MMNKIESKLPIGKLTFYRHIKVMPRTTLLLSHSFVTKPSTHPCIPENARLVSVFSEKKSIRNMNSQLPELYCFFYRVAYSHRGMSVRTSMPSYVKPYSWISINSSFDIVWK
jgi:hypothetical protein